MALVLVVDDEPDSREVIRINLEVAGYLVATAGDADEALAAIALERPDAVLLDVLRPGTDGWTVLERLKAGTDAIDAPVLVLTALARTEDRLRGAIEGAVACLTKPFDPSELVAAVDAALDPDAPPEHEQRRRARQAALEALARIEAHGREPSPDLDAPRVRLTALEHGPARTLPPQRLSDAHRRLALLTGRQRELLELIRSEGSVSAAAAAVGTSRSNVYAGLRRIVHRLGLRDTTELLRLLDAGELLAPQSSA